MRLHDIGVTIRQEIVYGEAWAEMVILGRAIEDLLDWFSGLFCGGKR